MRTRAQKNPAETGFKLVGRPQSPRSIGKWISPRLELGSQSSQNSRPSAARSSQNQHSPGRIDSRRRALFDRTRSTERREIRLDGSPNVLRLRHPLFYENLERLNCALELRDPLF